MKESGMNPSTDTKPLVVMLSGDLLFASKVKAAAESCGWKVYLGSNLPAPDAHELVGADIKLVVLDLSSRSGLTDRIVHRCSEQCPQAKIVAFGSHVHVDRLQAARKAGIEHVLTNGQFDAGMRSWFAPL